MRMSLRAARINAGLKQSDAANELKVTKKTVSSWESGKTKPKIDKIDPICSLYGVGIDDIDWGRA